MHYIFLTRTRFGDYRAIYLSLVRGKFPVLKYGAKVLAFWNSSWLGIMIGYVELGFLLLKKRERWKRNGKGDEEKQVDHFI